MTTMPTVTGGRSARVAALALAASLAAGPVTAACTLPVPPDPATKPARPTPPVRSACVDAQPGTPGCLGWEGHRFNEEVRAYNAKAETFRVAAEAYVAKLNGWLSAGADYARCEVGTLR